MKNEVALTVKDVAHRLNVSKDVIYDALTKGDLRGYKVGKSWRVDEEAIEAFKEAKSNQTTVGFVFPHLANRRRAKA